MSSKSNKSLSKQDKDLSKQGQVMRDVVLAQSLFHEAFPSRRYGKVESILYEAVRFLKPRVEPRIDREFTARRARAIKEGRARIVHGAELDALREAKIEEARRERDELRQRLSSLDAALAMADEEFHGPTLEALRAQARGLGGEPPFTSQTIPAGSASLRGAGELD